MNATGAQIVGVLGAGTMGAGIAQLAAQTGYRETAGQTSP